MVSVSRTRIFLVAALLAFALFLTCIGLHEYLYTFNPYSWAFPVLFDVGCHCKNTAPMLYLSSQELSDDL